MPFSQNKENGLKAFLFWFTVTMIINTSHKINQKKNTQATSVIMYW